MNLTPIIITGIVCALIGVAIGSLLSGLSKDTKAEPPQQDLHEGEWIEQVTLVSDKEGKYIFPQFQGQVYRSEKELPTEKRQLLVKVLLEIRTWLGESPAAVVQPVVIAAASVPAPAVSQPTTEVTPLQPEALVQTLTPPPTKPSMNPIDLFAKAIQADSKQVSKAPKSIVAQIDEILQEKLEGSPLEKRGIRLMELPGKGMVVLVGLDQYEGVDEVPDEEIRTIIRSSAKDWENRLEMDGKPK